MPTIRILPGGRFNDNSTINVLVNGARTDFKVGPVISVTDEQLALIEATGASYTVGTVVLGTDPGAPDQSHPAPDQAPLAAQVVDLMNTVAALQAKLDEISDHLDIQPQEEGGAS